MHHIDDGNLLMIQLCLNKDDQGEIQSLANEMNSWCIENDMKLNLSKCKNMIISFAKDRARLDQAFIEGHELTPVYSSADLKWNYTHIFHVVSKRLYFQRLLNRVRVDHASFITVCNTCIRSVLEFGCQTWNFGVSQYLSDDVERIQKRALGFE